MSIKSWLRKRATTLLLGPGALNITNQHPEGMIKQFCFGNVALKVWLNRSWRGNPYFKFTLEQVMEKDGKRIFRKTFYRDDLDDIDRCILRVKTWLRDGENFERRKMRR